MGKGHKWPTIVDPPISVGNLVLMLTTYGQQVAFLIQHDILSSTGLCYKCNNVITGQCIEKTNARYWKCKSCNVLTTARFGTVLYKSKLKLKNWILLAFCFIERNRTYAQTKAEASLPQEGYEDRTLSERTINRWFRFFRSLCRKDFRKNRVQLGGKGVIVEGDESLFGKMKFGRGSSKNRRRAWVFGMIDRETRRMFVYVCPKDQKGNYKRTRRALMPMIIANVKQESLVLTDGWQAYRKMKEYGFDHRWVNHTLHYCDPDDPTINTNLIEGLWYQIKRWLPQSGCYNLEEYLELYQWFQQQKHEGRHPFWRLLELIAESNEYDLVNEAQKEEEPNVWADNAEDEEEDDDREELAEDYESDGDEHYWFDCAWCKDIYLDENERDAHMEICRMRT